MFPQGQKSLVIKLKEQPWEVTNKQIQAHLKPPILGEIIENAVSQQRNNFLALNNCFDVHLPLFFGAHYSLLFDAFELMLRIARVITDPKDGSNVEKTQRVRIKLFLERYHCEFYSDFFIFITISVLSPVLKTYHLILTKW